MKRRDLLSKFHQHGWWILRDTGDHTILTNGKETESIPRHCEVKENLAKALVKRWGLK